MQNPTTYGHFNSDNTAYVISNPATPRHWYNYLWNSEYVSLFSQVGQGESLCQDAVGNRIPVVSARMAFLFDTDSKTFWSVNGLGEFTDFKCTHGLGWSEIKSNQAGIRSGFRIFVPENERCEIWTIQLKNESNCQRLLQLTPFVDTLLEGPTKPQAYYLASGYFDTEMQAAILHKHLPYADGNETFNYLIASEPISGFDTSERQFIGYGTRQRPDAVAAGRLRNSDCETEKPILALNIPVTLDPGAETEIHVIAGAALSIKEIATIKTKYFRNNQVDAELRQVQQTIQKELGGIEFETPLPHLNQFSHWWLKRQISLGTRWARVRHNGFRDLVQDIGAMAIWNPTEAFERFKRVLSFQYSSGYAPRTWLNGEILDKGFADNHVWIAFTAYTLIMTTGDLTLLNAEIPFNDASSASLYQHVKRAVDYLWNDRGMYGLCRMHHGDWNDCLNHIGPQGKGVSIWLSMAGLLANRQFAELARAVGNTQDAEIAENRALEMKTAINSHGWDGAYYLRAISDDGEKIGSHTNEQGTFYLNPQAWAVLSGAADANRAQQVMAEVEQRLETDIGTIGVENAYSYPQPLIGSMSHKKPGVQENGGVYLHSAAFRLVADCMLTRREAVERNLTQLLAVINPENPINDGEPYVFS
ncbi:hypothetical protein KAH55_04035, partial [bacterium]|nr:hypothetical protein [bacterium]